MRILGLDYGDSRIGVAISDLLGFTAQSAGLISEKNFERQLEAVISQIDGAGKTRVMVTVESTVSYEYATDDSYSESKYESEIVIIGSDKALIKKIDNPEVAGVLVICDGGDSAVIKEKILKAVATVLDISSNKVYITK